MSNKTLKTQCLPWIVHWLLRRRLLNRPCVKSARQLLKRGTMRHFADISLCGVLDVWSSNAAPTTPFFGFVQCKDNGKSSSKTAARRTEVSLEVAQSQGQKLGTEYQAPWIPAWSRRALDTRCTPVFEHQDITMEELLHSNGTLSSLWGRSKFIKSFSYQVTEKPSCRKNRKTMQYRSRWSRG